MPALGITTALSGETGGRKYQLNGKAVKKLTRRGFQGSEFSLSVRFLGFWRTTFTIIW